mmetsp:Transcript_5885/g.9781  ORF Transcript_5885/g.9781 Transcript_5885/m.9781 type:complete len:541 (+) Transcript_5885:61-1683(+)
MTAGESSHSHSHRISSKELEDSVRLAHQNDFHVCKLLLYSKPNQRQRWGDHQIHPVVNYGDLFFDLYYVAAAYNLSNIIRQSPTADGFLYFIACFCAVFGLWMDKTMYDARYFTYDDIYHRVYSVANLVALASVVLHIRPVDVLSSPKENVEAFALSVSLLAGSVFSAMRYLEMLWIGYVGEKSMYYAARRDAAFKMLPIIFYCAASIYAGLQYFGNDDSGDDDHRMLAGDPYEKSETTDVPIYLILAGSASHFAVSSIIVMFAMPKDSRSITVPMNIDFTIHRFGEWTMLMLGESILSLLIVASPTNSKYYAAFFSGILSVILLQYMHFRSQPSKADDHAMRRKKSAGFAFAFLMQVYSAALIILGTSYKMLLYEFTYEDALAGRRQRSLLPMPRWLAGDDGALQFDTDDRRQRIAHFFCASFAVVYFCSDAMLLAHRGLKDNMGRCHCGETKKAKINGIILLVLRVAILVFIATLSQYETDPLLLTLIGLATVFGQVVLRVVSSIIFADDRVHVDLKENQEQEEALEGEKKMAAAGPE